MQSFCTSYGYDKILLKTLNNSIIIEQLPFQLRNKFLMLGVKDSYNRDIIRTTFLWNKSQKISIGNLENGTYYLNIHVKVKTTDKYYWPYFQSHSLCIKVVSFRLHFIVAQTINENRKFMATLMQSCDFLESALQPSTLCQSNDRRIVSLAQKITRFKVTAMQKVQAIHDWVAENIYYDFDTLKNKSYDRNWYDAISVLETKKCVCRGFANLGVALMRAVGVPAIGLSCYALDIDSDGGWDLPINQTSDANHIITTAFVDNRWILMDITWDSDNQFLGGNHRKITGMGVSRKYFDTTLEMISNTHRLVSSRII